MALHLQVASFDNDIIAADRPRIVTNGVTAASRELLPRPSSIRSLLRETMGPVNDGTAERLL
jgi:hypothetical protein